jgi:hypothetical protein
MMSDSNDDIDKKLDNYDHAAEQQLAASATRSSTRLSS